MDLPPPLQSCSLQLVRPRAQNPHNSSQARICFSQGGRAVARVVILSRYALPRLLCKLKGNGTDYNLKFRVGSLYVGPLGHWHYCDA